MRSHRSMRWSGRALAAWVLLLYVRRRMDALFAELSTFDQAAVDATVAYLASLPEES